MPITLLGLPWDGSSSFQRGAAEAPARIREALHSPSSNTWNERGDDLSAPGLMHDAGDVALPDDAAAARAAIEASVRGILEQGHKPLLLGGDHSITYPILRAFRSSSTPGPSTRVRSLGAGGEGRALTVLHLDAHGDLYDEFEGNRYSHACPFARVMEERLASRLVQVGVRTLTAHQRSQAAKFGVEILGADRWREALPLIARFKAPVYVSLDLDVLEPMLAPGLSHPEPGGLTVRDVLEILAALRVPLAGADIVEYNPRNDVRDLTARVAAKFVKELTGLLKG
jgi:arginase